MDTILVVEDEVQIRELICRYLERDGYTVQTAASGNEALEKARAGVDLVVLDIMIPRPDGLDVTRILRSTSALPILIVSARGEEADRVAGLELGADDYLTKPFPPRELLARVKALHLFARDGSQQRVIGTETMLESPGFLDHVFQGGDLYERGGRAKTHVNWIPLDIDGPRSHVARLASVHTRDSFFTDVRRNILVACLVSFFAVLLVALILSRALARPIRKLASLVDRFGREGYELRSDVRGTAEVEELSSSFNRMADYIESNTNELRERKEEAERTEALRRQFLSDVSHNLRTPLAAISSLGENIHRISTSRL